MMGPVGRSRVIALAMALMTDPAVSAAGSSPAQARPEEGAALFIGKLPLTAHLRGHDEMLPTFAARCSNCHARDETAKALGPALTRRSLMGLRQRRGGPESAFDAKSFCHLLRTRIDPRAIVVRSAMPVYRLDDLQCAALWTFLIEQEP
jgi:mono/diheme cytochrome c family protein